MKGCRSFTDVEIEKLLLAMSPRNAALVILGLKTGLRISEMLSLRVEDVFCNGEITPTVHIKRRNLKGKREGRTLPLNPLVKIVLKRYFSLRQNVQGNEPLFLSESRLEVGKAITRVQAWRIINGASRRMGMVGTIGTHSLRKTFAQKMYNALDKDIVKTCKALGHSSLENTIAYLSFMEEDIDKAMMSL